MSRVFVSVVTGAVIYVFAEDHCPPHVHARHRGEDWVARVGFSFVGNAVDLISIAPLRNVPRQRTVGELLDEIGDQLAACRRSWWTIRRTTCLTDRWVTGSAASGIAVHTRRKTGAKQVAAASYDPGTERLRMTIRDGTTTEVSAQP